MLNENIDKKLAEIDKYGFAIFPQVLSKEDVEKARAAYHRMVKKIEAGKYPFCRIYDDLLLFNVAGIEHLFHPDIYEKDIFSAAVKSQCLEISAKLLKTEKPNMVLNRIHTTVHYSHSGIWHRDADPTDNSSIQIALYLYDEDRLWAIPGSHNRPNTEEETRLMKLSRKSILPNEIAVGGKAGDLCLFRSSILHRGSSISKRAHIHFRFSNNPAKNAVDKHMKEWFNRPEVLEVANPTWKKMFTETMTDGEDNTQSCAMKRENSWSRRIFGTIFYYLLFMFPENSPIFERRLWLVPSLKIRKLIGLEKDRGSMNLGA